MIGKQSFSSSPSVEELSSSNSAPLQDEVILAPCILAIWDNKLRFLSHLKAKLPLPLCWCYGFIFAVTLTLGASMWVSKAQKLLLHEASFLNEMLWKGKRWNSTIISKISMQCPHNCSQENVIIVKYNQKNPIEKSARFRIVAHRLHYKQGLKHHVHPCFLPSPTWGCTWRLVAQVTVFSRVPQESLCKVVEVQF